MGKIEKQLREKIDRLIVELRKTEEALARANFENQTLRSQVADLKADIETQKRKLKAMQGQ